MLILSAIRHFVTITLFIVSTPPGSSTEHMFSYGDKMKTATAKVAAWYNANIEMKCARFQEKYSKVCITRTAVNENVYVRTPALSTCKLQVQQLFLLPG